MKSVFFILMMLVLSACSSYVWVDTSDCKDEIGQFKKCLEK